jgi:hypothetical protein
VIRPRVALTLLALATLGAASGSILARYSFDEDDLATGPDTFHVFRDGKGKVALTSAFHLSGYRGLEIRDVKGDGDFPELQGYFPLQTRGRLFAHFAFLTAEPAEELNIALAGPEWFRLKKDGIAFWLATQQGRLVHYSDSIPKRLFAVTPFVWYLVDVDYDLPAGTYDLTIRQEGRTEPLVALRAQPNAPNQPGSGVDKFSFVGDPYGDRSNVTYYVDDVVIGTSQSVREIPWAAPGRRKLFVDLFTEYERLEKSRPRCLPVVELQDLGLDPGAVRELAGDGRLDVLERAIGGGEAPPPRAGEDGRLRAAIHWSQGCAALDRGRLAAALQSFDAAAAAVPEGRLYGLSAVLPLIGLKRLAEADERLAVLSGTWRGDVRYAVVSAMAGIARGDLRQAEEWLREGAERVAAREADPLVRRLRTEPITPELLRNLQERFPEAWRDRLEETLVPEQYFNALVWNGGQAAARDYALRMAERLRAVGLPWVDWTERAGDAAFYARDLVEARSRYQQAADAEPDRPSAFLKLADIAFLDHDLETERRLREKYYGTLRED